MEDQILQLIEDPTIIVGVLLLLLYTVVIFRWGRNSVKKKADKEMPEFEDSRVFDLELSIEARFAHMVYDDYLRALKGGSEENKRTARLLMLNMIRSCAQHSAHPTQFLQSSGLYERNSLLTNEYIRLGSAGEKQ